LKGLAFIDVLYQAILNKRVLNILYQSFKAREASYMLVHPQLLKEYNNRWFLVCFVKGYLYNLALDRMLEINEVNDVAYIDQQIDADSYFKDVVGVTVTRTQRLRKVTFRMNVENSPYVKTKPFHSSQTILHEDHKGTVFQILVQINYELERMILGFGDAIEVLDHKGMRDRIDQKHKYALRLYEKE